MDVTTPETITFGSKNASANNYNKQVNLDPRWTRMCGQSTWFLWRCRNRDKSILWPVGDYQIYRRNGFRNLNGGYSIGGVFGYLGELTVNGRT